MTDKIDNATLLAGHVVSFGAVIGAIMNYLPHIAALLGVVWYLIMITESKTVQNILQGHRERKQRKRHE